jgi:hypothetical protein
LLQAGVFVKPTLLIAAEVAALAGPSELAGPNESITFVTPIVQWYPWATSGVYAKGGIGFATGYFRPGTERVTSDGVGLSVGAGVEVPLRRIISVAPYAVYRRTVGARVGRPTTMRGTSFHASALQFGLLIGFHRARTVRPMTIGGQD